MNETFTPEDYQDLFLPFYRTETTLREDVLHLSNPETEIDMKSLTSIILKYWTAFYEKSSPDRLHCLDQITTDFQQFFLESRPPFRSAEHYALNMLGDIATTVAILREIVSQTLDLPNSVKAYGVDSGSGTGILLLAQHILASRNRIREQVDLVGLEINRSVSMSADDLANDLFEGRVVCADVMKAKSFDSFRDREIFCLTNENIPDYGQTLGHEPAYLATLKHLPSEPLYCFPESPLIYQLGSARASFHGFIVNGKTVYLSEIGRPELTRFSDTSGYSENLIRKMCPVRWRSINEFTRDYQVAISRATQSSPPSLAQSVD